MDTNKCITHGTCKILCRFFRKNVVFLCVVAMTLCAIAEVRDFSPSEIVDFNNAFRTVVKGFIGAPMMCGADEETVRRLEASPYLVRLNTATGCVDEINRLMPTGSCYSVEEVGAALAQCVTNMMFVSRIMTDDPGSDEEDHPEFLYAENMLRLVEIFPPSRDISDRLRPLVFNSEMTGCQSEMLNAAVHAMGPSDETTRFVYSVSTNSSVFVGSVPDSYADALTSVYTNGCDASMSGVVRNAAATFSAAGFADAHFGESVDRLFKTVVPGYDRSELRYRLITNLVLYPHRKKYFLPIKEELDALQEADFTTPVFSGTPQR